MVARRKETRETRDTTLSLPQPLALCRAGAAQKTNISRKHLASHDQIVPSPSAFDYFTPTQESRNATKSMVCRSEHQAHCNRHHRQEASGGLHRYRTACRCTRKCARGAAGSRRSRTASSTSTARSARSARAGRRTRDGRARRGRRRAVPAERRLGGGEVRIKGLVRGGVDGQDHALSAVVALLLFSAKTCISRGLKKVVEKSTHAVNPERVRVGQSNRPGRELVLGGCVGHGDEVRIEAAFLCSTRDTKRRLGDSANVQCKPRYLGPKDKTYWFFDVKMKLMVSPGFPVMLLGSNTLRLFAPTITFCVAAEALAMRKETAATVEKNMVTGLQLHEENNERQGMQKRLDSKMRGGLHRGSG